MAAKQKSKYTFARVVPVKFLTLRQLIEQLEVACDTVGDNAEIILSGMPHTGQADLEMVTPPSLSRLLDDLATYKSNVVGCASKVVLRAIVPLGCQRDPEHVADKKPVGGSAGAPAVVPDEDDPAGGPADAPTAVGPAAAKPDTKEEEAKKDLVPLKKGWTVVAKEYECSITGATATTHSGDAIAIRMSYKCYRSDEWCDFNVGPNKFGGYELDCYSVHASAGNTFEFLNKPKIWKTLPTGDEIAMWLNNSI